MRWIVGIVVLLWCEVLSAQVQSATLLLEGAGFAHSSIMGYSAYPAQSMMVKGMVGMNGRQYFQSGLKGVGLVAAARLGTHVMVAGGDRFGNGVLHWDRFDLGYAVPLSKHSNLGIRVGFQQWGARGYASKRSPNVGIGWSSIIAERLQWKVQVDGLEGFWTESSLGGYKARSAVCYNASELIGLSVDVLLEEQQPAVLIPAVHYAITKNINIKLGAISDFNSIAFGFVYGSRSWTLEFANSLHNKLGISSVIVMYCKL